MNDLGKPGLALVFFAVFFQFSSIGPIELSNMNDSPVSTAISEIKIALAASQYGILGQLAPELSVSYWIDGNGKAMAPIHLADYRGKVVYLYFFQDW